MKEVDSLIEIAKNNIEYSKWAQLQDLEGFSVEVLKEAQELVDAVKNNDVQNIKEELGDVLWTLIMTSAFFQKKYDIKLDESLSDTIKKLERRKPHIFEKKHATLEEEDAYWIKIKKQEKGLK